MNVRDIMEVRPCPFCGSRDIEDDLYRGMQMVSCNTCGAKGPEVETGDWVTEEALYRSWNRREWSPKCPHDAARDFLEGKE